MEEEKYEDDLEENKFEGDLEEKKFEDDLEENEYPIEFNFEEYKKKNLFFQEMETSSLDISVSSINKSENENINSYIKLLSNYDFDFDFDFDYEHKSNKLFYYFSTYKKLEEKIQEIYLFKNYLIQFCKFSKKDFDSRGDFLIPNLNNITKRGKEDYYPPYGWIGIGLNVLAKYKDNKDDEDGKWLFEKENSEWANAYLGFNQEKNKNNDNIKILDNIKENLHDLVINNENLKIIEKKVDFDDKRHWIKKYEKGIYLNSKIKNAEKDAGLVIYNGIIYKVLLMARVKTEEICQSNNEDLWVLDKKFIRVYRILFKKINEK